MLTIFFEYTFVVFFMLLLFLFPFLWWRMQQRLKYLQKLARLGVLNRQQRLENEHIYVSEIIDICVKKLYFSFSVQAKDGLSQLVGGRITKAAKLLALHNHVLAILLEAHNNATEAVKKLQKQNLQNKYENNLLLFCSLTAWQIFNSSQAQIWFEKVSRCKLKIIERAYYDYAEAHICVLKGDMAKATQNIQQALKTFRSRQYVAEEAACYIKLAEIYRLSCMCDAAYTMLTAASDIYLKLNAPLSLASAVATKGILMLFENRYEEAASFYEQAKIFAPTEKMRADIINQQALLNLHIGKLDVAKKQVKQTKNFYQKIGNKVGLAFSLQLEGQIDYEQKHYRKSITVLRQAANLYLKQRNYTAYAESVYSIANALCKQDKYLESEDVLLRLLRYLKKHNSAFHIAYIYSLLGLINMETNNLRQAEKWFEKSLDMEQQNHRYAGAAVDALNLAIVHQLLENTEPAQKYSKQALDFAAKTADESFIELIKSKILH